MSTAPSREVDPWRFAGGFLKNALSGQIPAEPSHDAIPFTPVTKPLSESRIALLSTAGLSWESVMSRRRSWPPCRPFCFSL